jgi:uncharacterized protein
VPDDLQLVDGIFATPHRFIWLPESRTAILADLHLGASESLAKAGLAIPDHSAARLRESWAKIIQREPRHAIIAGDLFDSPDPPNAAYKLVNELFGTLPPEYRLTLTPGNHDPLSPSQFIQRPCEVTASVNIGDTTISHGHERLDHSPAVWIVGHQHPAVTLSTRVQSAKMACYVTCKMAAEKKLIVLPAFSRAPLGSNLLTGRHWLLPLPRPQEDNIQIAGLVEPGPPREPQVLDFGPLSLLAGNG